MIYASARIFYGVCIFPILRFVFISRFTSVIHFDLTMFKLCLFTMILVYILNGFTRYTWQALWISSIDGFGMLATPILRGILSMTVSSQHQGSLFSSVIMLQQIGHVLASVMFPLIWASTVGTSFTSLFHFIQSLLACFAFIVSLFVRDQRLLDLIPKLKMAIQTSEIIKTSSI